MKTILKLIKDYITKSHIEVRQLSDGHFIIYVSDKGEGTFWRVTPEYLLINIEKTKELFKIERVIYVP